MESGGLGEPPGSGGAMPDARTYAKQRSGSSDDVDRMRGDGFDARPAPRGPALNGCARDEVEGGARAHAGEEHVSMHGARGEIAGKLSFDVDPHPPAYAYARVGPPSARPDPTSGAATPGVEPSMPARSSDSAADAPAAELGLCGRGGQGGGVTLRRGRDGALGAGGAGSGHETAAGAADAYDGDGRCSSFAPVAGRHSSGGYDGYVGGYAAAHGSGRLRSNSDSDGGDPRRAPSDGACGGSVCRLSCCLCAPCVLLALLAILAPPDGADVWLSFGLCPAPTSAGAALDTPTALAAPQAEQEYAQVALSSHWLSLPLDEEEACPAAAASAPSSLRVERDHFPTFGSVWPFASSSTFFVRLARDSFSQGSVAFRILGSGGRTLLPAKRYPLLYLTETAVVCNASTARLCTQAVEGELDGAATDPIYAADSFDAASRRRRRLAAARAGARDGERRGVGSRAHMGVADGAGEPSAQPAGRRLLKGGGFSPGGGGGGGSSSSRSFGAGGAHSRGTGSSGGGWFHRAQPSGAAYAAASAARARALGPGFPYHASPAGFTRPHAYTAGTTFMLLHHGNRYGYAHGYSSACATAGCAIPVDSNLAQDELLDATFDVRARDFPLTFELLSADLSLGGAGSAAAAAAAGTPLLLFGFAPL
ncbi:hypothetical protein KFE25_004531 [Diacronema lutheri]|uniref:Uncharacterized protein n=2 Tax=Diacronema lutheri TaxID=2081491 RepID=A0A8J6C5S1_DIALT|nr:hypothetical protein KFE25_004531 [Diacronema lutheri]